MTKKLNVVELFAGVGGFRLGLEKADKEFYRTVWANQWEPSKKIQYAFDCYDKRFSEGIKSNEDISTVEDKIFQNLNIDLLVGGFPCQDYSVARSLSGEKGIYGKKGVLFWEIKRIIENSHPNYVLLENVDRLIKSPSKQRGRDFAVMLAVFRDLGYVVEWRVINASDYGNVQRRRRVFIFAYKSHLDYSQKQKKFKPFDIVMSEGFFATTFPVEKKLYKERRSEVNLPDDLVEISDDFAFSFHTAGIMRDGYVTTLQPIPKEIPFKKLKDILVSEEEIDEEFYLSEHEIEKFGYLRGAKKVERTAPDGSTYYYSEGGMSETDNLEFPGRTMLTSEGSVNRSTHIVIVKGKKRYLTPTECERLNGFPDNWTETMPKRMRYFCMGNALVVNLITEMGKTLKTIAQDETVEITPLELNLSSDILV